MTCSRDASNRPCRTCGRKSAANRVGPHTGHRGSLPWRRSIPRTSATAAASAALRKGIKSPGVLRFRHGRLSSDIHLTQSNTLRKGIIALDPRYPVLTQSNTLRKGIIALDTSSSVPDLRIARWQAGVSAAAVAECCLRGSSTVLIGSRDITKKRMIIVFGIDSMGDGERGVTQPHTYRAGSR